LLLLQPENLKKERRSVIELFLLFLPVPANSFHSRLASHRGQSACQPLANFSTYQINAHQIMSTFRNDDVSVAFRRFDKLHMHWSNRSNILLNNGFHRATALGNVAAQATDEPNVVGRIHEDF